MPAKVVGFEVNADHLACLLYHYPGCLIANWEDPVIWPFAVFDGVITKPVSHFLWDEYDFMLFAALGFSEDQLPILNVIHGELQHLTDPHSTASHQLKHQSISDLERPENDFINSFFFDDFPSGNHFFPIQLSNHRGIAGIPSAGIDIVSDEIEKR